MTCPSCSSENRPNAKFCRECGGSLAPVCRECSAKLPPDSKFCDECGTPVGQTAAPQDPSPTAAPAGARKVVTILFADLVGSTALHERLDVESSRRFMESYYATARRAVESHGGTVLKLLGDGVLAVFGIPLVAEDDGIRGVRAGMAVQVGFRALADQYRSAVGETGLRIAINSGEVIAEGENEIIGDPVNVAARLQELGSDGDVVIGEATRGLVSAEVSLEALGSFELKGREEAVRAYRVRSLEGQGKAAAAFVGRKEELARLTSAYSAAVAENRCTLAVVMGSPGLGKSRLIDEFERRQSAETTIVTAHCDAAGGATFAPIAEAFREHLSLDAEASADTILSTVTAALPAAEPDVERIAEGVAGVIAGTPGAPEETFFVIRRFLAGLAGAQPVVLVVDDLHWAEPLLLDLMDHLVQWGQDTPLFVLIGARPELRQMRSSFGRTGGIVSDVITLDGLDAGAAMQLAAGVLGAADLPAAVAAKVLATSEGNPLFIGELIRMLVEDGALARDGDRWVAGERLDEFEMPPTIHALLAARIERLDAVECAILERAAVVGRHFSRGAISALLDDGLQDLDSKLESLERSELIERDAGWMLGEPVLRFHHVLIRDAAYRRLLKQTRAELHEKLADWIEARGGDAPENDETIGRHLEEAHRLIEELRPADDVSRELGRRASSRLAAAGKRALDGDDAALASVLYERALARIDANDPSRAELALDGCEALLSAGDVAQASELVDEIGRLADSQSSDRLRAWRDCFAGQHTVLTAPEGLSETADTVSIAAERLADLGDAAGEAKGHFVHALALSRLGKVGACESSLDKALAAARRANDRRRANTVLAVAPLAALWGPSPVTRASGRCLDVVRVLRITQGAPAVEAVALSCQGVLEALRGRSDAARRMIASGREMVEELGIAQRLYEADVFDGYVSLLEGDLPRAEATLRAAYEGLSALDLGVDTARAAVLLARALIGQGRFEEAEALSYECERLAGDDLKSAIAWRGVRAETLAHRGEHDAAVKLARAAVEIAAATDALLDHADARHALAVALRASGRDAEAQEEDRAANRLWHEKGATQLVEEASSEGFANKRDTELETSARTGRHTEVTGIYGSYALEPLYRLTVSVRDCDYESHIACMAEDYVEVNHQTGTELSSDQVAASSERLNRSDQPLLAHRPIVFLGDSCALWRRNVGAGGREGSRYDVGEYDHETLIASRWDEYGVFKRTESFSSDSLYAAISRLYELYADEIEAEDPKGAERARNSAEWMRFWNEAVDADEWEPRLHPDFVFIDHRRLGSWNARGKEEAMAQVRGLANVAQFAVIEDRDVLAVSPDAILRRQCNHGIATGDGGEFEREFLAVHRFDETGQLVSQECFETDDEPAAIACYEEIVSSTRYGRRLNEHRNPFLRRNAALVIAEDFETCINTRDADRMASLVSDELSFEHHPTAKRYSKREFMITWRSAMKAESLEYGLDMLATLGDGHALYRHNVVVDGLSEADLRDFGETRFVEHIVVTANADGTCRRIDLFSEDSLSEAFACLYQRYAESLEPGPACDRAMNIAGAVAAMTSTAHPDEIAPHFHPDLKLHEHRSFNTWSSQSGQELVAQFARQRELAPDFRPVLKSIAASTDEAFLMRADFVGTGSTSGGDFENHVLALYAMGDDGRITLVEGFDAEEEGFAVERFTELMLSSQPYSEVHSPSAEPDTARGRAIPTPNEASAIGHAFDQMARTRRPDPVEQLLTDDFVFHHHGTGASYGKDGFMTSTRGMFAADRFDYSHTLTATLGRSLALDAFQLRLSGMEGRELEDFGDVEFDDVFLIETAENARCRRIELFPAEKLGAAYVAMLERAAERTPAGPENARAKRTAAAFRQVLLSTDPATVTAALEPDFTLVDRRTLATWESKTPNDLAEHMRLMRELAPDFAIRVCEILASGPAGLVTQTTFYGTGRDSSGYFGNEVCMLYRLGAGGDIAEMEVFEKEDEEMALARFHELTSGAQPPAVGRPRSEASGPALDDAIASAQFRDWVEAYIDGTETGDWTRLRDRCAPELVLEDNRRLVLVSGGLDTLLNSVTERARTGARPHVKDVRALGDLAAYCKTTWTGEKADGDFEIDHHTIIEWNEAGKWTRFALYDIDDEAKVEAEIARFAQLTAEPVSYREAESRVERRIEAAEPVSHQPAIPGSRQSSDAAAMHFDAWVAAYLEGTRSGDFRALRAHCEPDLVLDDNQRMSLVKGDIETVIASLQERTRTGARPRTHRVETIAPRIGCCRMIWTGDRTDGDFEIEYIALIEWNAAGRWTWFGLYDADSYEEARAEAARRAAERTHDTETGENVALREATALLAEFRRLYKLGTGSGDWQPVRDLCMPDFTLDEKRRMSLVQGDRETMLTSLAERARTAAILRHPSIEAFGSNVALFRTNWSRGDDFEVEFFSVMVWNHARRFTHIATYDLEDEATARADAERRAIGRTPPASDPDSTTSHHGSSGSSDNGPFVVPPNFASLANDRLIESLAAPASSTSLDELVAPDYMNEDRRKDVGVTLDRETRCNALRGALGSGWRFAYTPLQHAGERIVLQKAVATNQVDGSAAVVELLQLDVVDEDGRLVRTISFDADDLAAACDAVFAQAAAESDALHPPGLAQLMCAWNKHDNLDESRRQLSEDFQIDDHRFTGMGRHDGDSYLRSVAAMRELIPNVRTAPLYELARSNVGAVYAHHTFGENNQGGEVETFLLVTITARGGEVTALEFFEPDRIENAVERLVELSGPGYPVTRRPS